jgi:hypothetical protein
MSVAVKVGDELKIRSFLPTLEKNAVQTLHQQITSTSYNSSSINFQIKAPAMNALMDSEVWMELTVDLTATQTGNAQQVSYDQIYKNWADCVSNAISNISVNYNGVVLTLPVTDIINAQNVVFLTNSDAKHKFSLCGGQYDAVDYHGVAGNADGRATGGLIGTSIQANGHDFIGNDIATTTSRGSCANRVAPAVLATGVLAGAGLAAHELQGYTDTNRKTRRIVPSGGNFQVKFMVPLAIAPFKYYKNCKTPNWAWWKNMSDVLPYFNGEINIQLLGGARQDNACAAMFYFQSSHTAADAVRGNAAGLITVAPRLHVRYYLPPSTYQLKPSYTLPIWTVQRYRTAISGTELVPALANQSATTENIRLDRVPDLILFYLQENRNTTMFKCAAPAVGAKIIDTAQMLPSFGQINNIQLTINTDAGTLTTQIQPEDFYNMYRETCSDPSDCVGDFTAYRCMYNVVALRRKHIASLLMSSGVSFPLNLQATVNWNFKQGKSAGAHSSRLDLFTTCYFGKVFLEVTKDLARLHYMNIDPNYAKKAIFNTGRDRADEGAGIRTGGSTATGGYVARIK